MPNDLRSERPQVRILPGAPHQPSVHKASRAARHRRCDVADARDTRRSGARHALAQFSRAARDVIEDASGL